MHSLFLIQASWMQEWSEPPGPSEDTGEGTTSHGQNLSFRQVVWLTHYCRRSKRPAKDWPRGIYFPWPKHSHFVLITDLSEHLCVSNLSTRLPSSPPCTPSLWLSDFLLLIFWGPIIIFSIVSAPFYNHPNSEEAFQFLHILTKSCCFPGFWQCPCYWMWGSISLWFWIIFPWWLMASQVAQW